MIKIKYKKTVNELGMIIEATDGHVKIKHHTSKFTYQKIIDKGILKHHTDTIKKILESRIERNYD